MTRRMIDLATTKPPQRPDNGSTLKNMHGLLITVRQGSNTLPLSFITNNMTCKVRSTTNRAQIVRNTTSVV